MAMSIGARVGLIELARAAALCTGPEEPGSGPARPSQRILLPLLAVVAFVLFAAPASLSLPEISWNGSEISHEAAEFRSGDPPLQATREPLDSRPALKRGGAAMVAVETSRRKVRAPQRPQAQPLILTDRFVANGVARAHARPWPWRELAPKLAEPGCPFPARGPPCWKTA